VRVWIISIIPLNLVLMNHSRHETLKSLLGKSDNPNPTLEDGGKTWDIDEMDFFESSSEEVTSNDNEQSPLKRQNVSGRQHGLSFIIAVEESEYTCPVVNGMGLLVSEMII
jgi:hypothetical protein